MSQLIKTLISLGSLAKRLNTGKVCSSGSVLIMRFRTRADGWDN